MKQVQVNQNLITFGSKLKDNPRSHPIALAFVSEMGSGKDAPVVSVRRSGVLVNGKPWNTCWNIEQWIAAYEDGKVVKPFDMYIDEKQKFVGISTGDKKFNVYTLIEEG